MTHKRTLFFIIILLFIALATYFMIQFAKGYRFSPAQRGFQPSGLLVATSVPDGAQVYIDGKLKTATNTTVFLTPGEYQVEIKKEGFAIWGKKLRIEKELVTKTDAVLFPLVPNLQSLTFTGASSPLVSNDGTKIVYSVNTPTGEKNGLWILEFSDFPFGISREPRQIVKNLTGGRDFSKATYRWSPDSSSLLVTFEIINKNTASKKTTKQTKIEENFLIDTASLITSSQLAEVAKTSTMTTTIIAQWEKEEKLKYDQKVAKLPVKLSEILKNNTNQIVFSPDETKILYIAIGEATIPDKIIPGLPGSSTQAEERNLKPHQTYVYDIKEDKNFLIIKDKECLVGLQINLISVQDKSFPDCTLRWFPGSRHLVLVEKDKIQILEYEGTNWLSVYSGNYQFPFAYANPSGNKLVILTNLSNLPDSLPNLYAVSLR
ncbi:MAG: PEGA domain-containing protein [bacterium]|nr:PEGA domain-containing protein [bacterium]